MEGEGWTDKPLTTCFTEDNLLPLQGAKYTLPNMPLIDILNLDQII